jgi:hypothetical protein
LVRFDDGTVGFVRNAFDAEMERIFAGVLDAFDGQLSRSPPGCSK